MARVLLALGRDHELLAREVSLWGHVIVAEAASRAEAIAGFSAETEVAIVSAELLERDVLAAADQAGVRLIVVASSTAQRQQSERFGLLELIHPVSDLERLSRILAGPMLIAPVARSGANLVTICGAPGSPGASTLAVNLASELGESLRVAVVDLDCFAPSLSAFWGASVDTPGVAAAARLVEVEAFSFSEFQRLSVPVAENVRLLSGLSALEHWPELSAERVAGVLGALREWNDVVIVDAGELRDRSAEALNDPFAPKRSASQSTAIELANRVVVVGAADPVSLARLVRAWPIVDAATRAEIVIGKLRSSALGVHPASQARSVCREFLSIEPSALLPFDAKSTDASLLAAQPLRRVAPRSALRRAIAELAAGMRPVESSEQSPGHRAVKPRRGRKAVQSPA